MPEASSALIALRARLAEVHDLERVVLGLFWDQQVVMPPAGGEARADQLATLSSLSHERLVSDETGELLEAAAVHLIGRDPEDIDAALVRVARRDRDKAVRVPKELKAELARAESVGQEAWAKAREADDWGAFAPCLERTVELKRAYAACFDGFERSYDALLDDYEPGTSTAEVERVFAQVRDGVVPLVAAIGRQADRSDEDLLRGRFPAAKQEALVRRILPAFGFDPAAWRLDPTAHPFATSLGPQDIRVTTRYDDDGLFMALFSSLHETGHALYEAGSDPALERGPLYGGVSLGVHESQSRLWENIVGRSAPFSRWLLPHLQEFFPDRFAGVDPARLHRAMNIVRPSLIRIEADEATYCLHVILRFELEKALLEGELEVADLPAAWNDKIRDYLGLEVPDAASGVLQDIHWAAGLIGYFPTYALGTVMASQIWDAAAAALPEVEGDIARGEFGPLREWLGENLYRHGRKWTPAETLERVAGGPLDAEPYLRYLESKFEALYDASASGGPATSCRRPDRGSGRRPS